MTKVLLAACVFLLFILIGSTEAHAQYAYYFEADSQAYRAQRGVCTNFNHITLPWDSVTDIYSNYNYSKTLTKTQLDSQYPQWKISVGLNGNMAVPSSISIAGVSYSWVPSTWSDFDDTYLSLDYAGVYRKWAIMNANDYNLAETGVIAVPGSINVSGSSISYYDGYGVVPPNTGVDIEYCAEVQPADFTLYNPSPICLAPNSSAIILNWDLSQNAADYEVYYYLQRGSAVYLGHTGNGTTNTFSVTGLTPGIGYSFKIVAVNGSLSTESNSGLWTDQRWGGFTIFPDCAPPGNFSATPNWVCPGANLPGKINLNWGTSTDASNYEVQYRTFQPLGAGIIYSNTNALSEIMETKPGHQFIPANQYGFRVTSSKPFPNPYITYSNNNWTDAVPAIGPSTFPDCSWPVINLNLTNGIITTNAASGPFLHVKQKEPVTIFWDTVNVPPGPAACTASIPSITPRPSQALFNAFNGNKSEAGSIDLPPISDIGAYQFTLTCQSIWGIENQNSATLHVEQLELPYIQTTGGDVHSNELIDIPKRP